MYCLLFSFIILCCIVLNFIVLSCIKLDSILFCCIVFYCVVLCCVVLYSIVLSCIVLCSILFCCILLYILLFYWTLQYNSIISCILISFPYVYLYYICADRNCVQLLNTHTGPVTALTFSSSTGLLISGGKDSTLKLYNVSVTASIGKILVVFSFHFLTLIIPYDLSRIY